MIEPTNYDWAKDIPCKNISIYGYCKHEDKCAFRHDTPVEQQRSMETPNTAASKLASVPIFTPSSASSAVSRPVTSSSTMGSNIISTPGLPIELKTPLPQLDKKKFNLDSPAFTPTATKFTSPKVSSATTFIPSEPMSHTLKFNTDTPSFSPSFSAALTPQLIPPVNLQQQQQVPPPPQQPPQPQSNDMYYQPHVPVATQATTSAYPLQYHLYCQLPPPHFQLPLAEYERDMNNLFIPNNLRETLQRKNEASNQILPQSNLPDHINNYHSLAPIDTTYDLTSKVFGGRTSLYKVMSSNDGNLYCLRKVELTKPIVEKSITINKKWSKVKSANVIAPLELFTNMSFNDNSLFIVYDYYPCSYTLIETHFQPVNGRNPVMITETLLWNYIVQLTNAISAVHAKNLAVRTIDVSKIIVTNQNRIRLSGCGVMDIIEYDELEDIEQLQRQDILKFGDLILSLSSTMMPPQSKTNLNSKEEIIAVLPLSDEFKQCVKYLISDGANLSDFQQMIAPQLLSNYNALQNSTDFMESQLSRELENGRLFRLITKLNFIIDRPEFLQDETWSETGERYPIKLFRDYVFHQYNEVGKPYLNMNHVLSCLNKLDAGIDEKLLLVSSDEKSCLIVSYKELKELIESSFRELSK